MLPVLIVTPVVWNKFCPAPLLVAKFPLNLVLAINSSPSTVPAPALIFPDISVISPDVLVILPLSSVMPALVSNTAVVITSSVLNLPSRGVV